MCAFPRCSGEALDTLLKAMGEDCRTETALYSPRPREGSQGLYFLYPTRGKLRKLVSDEPDTKQAPLPPAPHRSALHSNTVTMYFFPLDVFLMTENRR